MSPRAVILVAIGLVLVPTRVAADPDALVDPLPEGVPTTPASPMPTPHLRLSTGDGLLIAPNNRLYLIPRGSHIVTAETWNSLDVDMVRFQEQETRILAENESLRKASESWQPGWLTLAITAVSGISAGWYLHSKF